MPDVIENWLWTEPISERDTAQAIGDQWLWTSHAARVIDQIDLADRWVWSEPIVLRAQGSPIFETWAWTEPIVAGVPGRFDIIDGWVWADRDIVRVVPAQDVGDRYTWTSFHRVHTIAAPATAVPGHPHLSGDNDYAVLAVNVDTGNWSEYRTYSFNSGLHLGQDSFMLAPLGVYQVGGDVDGETLEQIDAYVKSGYLTFDTLQLKRLIDIAIQSTSPQPFEIVIRAPIGAGTTENTYADPGYVSDFLRETIVKLGKGLRSQSFQWELRNTGGGTFELSQVDINFAVLGRRASQ